MEAPAALTGDPARSLKPCILCGAVRVKRLYMQAHFPVVKCRGCGLVFADEHFKDEDLASFYTGDYYERAYVCHPKEIDSKVAADYVRAFELVSKLEEGGRLLDFGSARGTFLGELLKRGYGDRWDFKGIDINPDEIAMGIAAGNPVECGSVDGRHPPGASFDVVTAFSVLEHLQDPVAALKDLARILKPGGEFLAIVPSGNCLIIHLALLASRLPGRKVRAFTDNVFHEEHLTYFTRESFGRLCRMAGLEPVRWFYTPSYLEIHPPGFLIALGAYSLRFASWLLRRQTMLGVLARKV